MGGPGAPYRGCMTSDGGTGSRNIDLTQGDVSALFAEKLQAAFASLGRFNLAVFGKTGAGKSTLINAIFADSVAATGVGRSVTRGLDYYAHPGGLLGLYDSEGFETGTAGDVILAGLRQLVEDRRVRPTSEHIHAVWYTVRWSDRRFELPQQAFVRGLADLGLPVILVLTQVPTKNGQVHPEALEFGGFIDSLQLPLVNHTMYTNALADAFTGADVFGMDALLNATYQVVPDVATAALTAVQKLDWERKRQAARRVIRQAVAVSGGVGAAPIPFADAGLLVPTQVAMIARITAVYGLPPDRSRALAAAASVALTGGATMAGRYLAGTLLKFVPGGAVVGSVISGTVAASLTQAVGQAWCRVCEHALSLNPDEQSAFLAGPAPRVLFLGWLKGKPFG